LTKKVTQPAALASSYVKKAIQAKQAIHITLAMIAAASKALLRGGVCTLLFSGDRLAGTGLVFVPTGLAGMATNSFRADGITIQPAAKK
jgi:ABC-type uncharacterized transport system permease subunit